MSNAGISQLLFFFFLFFFLSFFLFFQILLAMADIWISLFTSYFRISYSDREFIGHFGCLPNICVKLWDVIETHSEGFKRGYLLWTLSFLKSYGTQTSLAGMFGVDQKTFREKVWLVLHLLYENLDEVSLLPPPIPFLA